MFAVWRRRLLLYRAQWDEPTRRAMICFTPVMVVPAVGHLSPRQVQFFKKLLTKRRLMNDPGEPEEPERMEPTLPPLFQGDAAVRRLLSKPSSTSQNQSRCHDNSRRADAAACPRRCLGSCVHGTFGVRPGYLLEKPDSTGGLPPRRNRYRNHRRSQRDTMRRCTEDLSQDVVAVFHGISLPEPALAREIPGVGD